MNHTPQGSWCNDHSETPRVRTLFRTKATPAPAAAATAPTKPDWPDLIKAILRSLYPFNDAYAAACQTIQDMTDQLQAAALQSQPTPLPA